MNQDLEHCHEKHSHPYTISCTTKVSVPPVAFEMWLVSRTRAAYTLYQHSWQLRHCAAVILENLCWDTTTGILYSFDAE